MQELIDNLIARLDYLLQSETIRMIDDKEFTPKDLDNALRNLKKENEDLKYQHYLEQSEIVRLRRQVEFLIGHDNVGA